MSLLWQYTMCNTIHDTIFDNGIFVKISLLSLFRNTFYSDINVITLDNFHGKFRTHRNRYLYIYICIPNNRDAWLLHWPQTWSHLYSESNCANFRRCGWRLASVKARYWWARAYFSDSRVTSACIRTRGLARIAFSPSFALFSFAGRFMY